MAQNEISNRALPTANQRRKDIAAVASIAANNDMDIGNKIADAMDKVGKDGYITVDESKSITTDVNLIEDMSFDRGHLSRFSNRLRHACRLLRAK